MENTSSRTQVSSDGLYFSDKIVFVCGSLLEENNVINMRKSHKCDWE